jgi:hypothetical protein
MEKKPLIYEFYLQQKHVASTRIKIFHDFGLARRWCDCALKSATIFF